MNVRTSNYRISMHSRMGFLVAVLMGLGLNGAIPSMGQSPVEYLYSGKLAEGEAALTTVARNL